MSDNPSTRALSRRDVIRSAAGAPGLLAAAESGQSETKASPPNIILIISDQFRWDCIGAVGVNPMNLTPNLDAMAREGTMFSSAICNQPVCAPARASIFTGQYPSRHGVWRNSIGLGQHLPTLATVLRDTGYSANYIGKWHLAGQDDSGAEIRAAVPANRRGGFLDLWEGSNVLELTSHPYEGDLYDADNRTLHFQDVYRTDFMTQRAQRFLHNARNPFFLTLSYLEVHHQNDIDAFVAPKEFAGRYSNAFVPQDLRPLPGSWPSQLADYYACVAKMDETVGTIRRTLKEAGLDKNTIVVFTSDHACHFKTRNAEYKRSPHESSIHVPLIVCGPGFNRSMVVPELVSQVDLMPSLLAAAGAKIPASVQGHSFLPLLDRSTESWQNEVFFEVSEFVTGRGLRTPRYTFAAIAPKAHDWKAAAAAPVYYDYQLYDNFADPYQHVNLAGRATHAAIAEQLRARLLARITQTSGQAPKIEPSLFPYS